MDTLIGMLAFWALMAVVTLVGFIGIRIFLKVVEFFDRKN